MGRLYEYAVRIQKTIESRDLDLYKTRGALAMKAGFIVTLIQPDDPDDPDRIQALREAAREVLDLELD